MNDIKRYDLEIDCESAYSRMAESEDGDYVQYQAYAAALSAKDARIKQLETEIETLREMSNV